MIRTKQLLSYDESFHADSIKGIEKVAMLLFVASKEIENLEAGTYSPDSLKDGKFLDTAIEFHKKEWQENTAFKRVSFDKYLEFIEMDFSKLEEIEKEYLAHLNSTREYYKINHPYFSWCEHRFPEGLKNASGKVKLKFSDLFKINGDSIEVNLSDEYFKTYTSNAKQIEKLEEIKTFFESSKKLNVSYEIVKKALRYWTRDIAYDLSSMEIDYYYLLKNVK